MAEFLGAGKSGAYTNIDSQPMSSDDTKKETMVSSREMAVFYINKKINLAGNGKVREELIKKKDALLQGRKSVDQLFAAILSYVTDLNVPLVKELERSRPSLSMEMMSCYKTLVNNFNNNCVNISKNTYVLGHLYKLANLCLSQFSEEQVLEAYSVKCEDRHRELVGVD